MKHKIAIVGAGWISDFYFQAYERLRDSFTLAGCVGNPSPEGQARLKKRCDGWGVAAYASFEDMLGDPSVDCVGILSPTTQHFAQAKAALAAGKNVLVEKPVALVPGELDELSAVAAKAGKVIFPGHNFVYRPVVRKAKEIIDSGALGTISYGSFRAAHFIPPEHAAGWRSKFEYSGGGAMMDSGTHLVYQSLYLLGKPQWLGGFSASKHYTSMQGEDVCQISLQYPDGKIGQIFQSWASADDTAGEIRIEGDKGVLVITDALRLNGSVIEDDSSYQSSFYHTLKSFGEAVDGAGAILSNVDMAKETLLLIEAAYESARTHKMMEFRT